MDSEGFKPPATLLAREVLCRTEVRALMDQREIESRATRLPSEHSAN